MATLATKTIRTAVTDNFTDAATLEGYFNLSISGTFTGTVTVQRTYDGTNWHDVDDFNGPTESVGFDPEYRQYRVGVKAGGLSSGSVTVRLGTEDREIH